MAPMARFVVGAFASVVVGAGAVSVTVGTKGVSDLAESTDQQLIRKEVRESSWSSVAPLLEEPTGAKWPAALTPSWEQRYPNGLAGGSDDQAAMRASMEQTFRIHSNMTRVKKSGSDNDDDSCTNHFHSMLPCAEGETIKKGSQCTWQFTDCAPQVSECKEDPDFAGYLQLIPSHPVCAGLCWIGEGSPCKKARKIDDVDFVVKQGESCTWEDDDKCPAANPASAKCECEPPKEYEVRPSCTIKFPKCKGKCKAVIPGHAKCKEADAKGTILEGSACTLECSGSMKSADPKTATCECSAALSGCEITPMEITCSSSCFPASAMILQPNGIETSVASLKQGDSVVGVSREWGLEDDTYLAEFHAGQPRQHSMHKFIEIRHLCQLGTPLRVTAGHLLYATEAKQAHAQPELMPAGKLRPGIHAVLAIGCDKSQPRERLAPSLVLNVTTVWAEGLYNPLTASRTAIVDGVATSNLALTSESIEAAFTASPLVRRIYEPLAWLLVAPVHVCAMLGLSTSWLSNVYLQEVVTSGLEKLGQFVLYASA